MVDISNYDFTSITDKIVRLEEYFINSAVNEYLETDSTISSTRRMRVIIDANYEKDDPNKVTNKQCQHLNATEDYILINILKKSEDLFVGTLGTWNITLVDLELK